MKQIDCSPRFLSGLKTLELCLTVYQSRYFDTYPRDLLHQLSKNENFLKHLTHLNCTFFEGLENYDELMGVLLSRAPKLSSINFNLGSQARYYGSADEVYRECKEGKVLKQLEKMNNLKTLRMTVYGIKTFVNNFVPTLSLQKVILDIHHSFYDPHLLDLFQEGGGLFFDHWKKLHNLGTLKILMHQIENSNDHLHKFILPLLQAIPALKKFRLELTNSKGVSWRKCEHRKPLDLSLLFDNVITLKQLQSLKVLNCQLLDDLQPTREYEKMIFTTKERQLLSNLTEINLYGDLLEESFDFKGFLRLFSPALDGESVKRSFKISFKSIQGFAEFVKLVSRMKNTKFNLDIGLKVQDTKGLDQIVEYFKLPIPLERDVVISLKISVYWRDLSVSEKGWEERDKNIRLIFKNFKLSLSC